MQVTNLTGFMGARINGVDLSGDLSAVVKKDLCAALSEHQMIVLPGQNLTLADQKTVAGTWVNYAPTTLEGCRLEDGDLVHFGKFGFRFMLNKQFKEGK